MDALVLARGRRRRPTVLRAIGRGTSSRESRDYLAVGVDRDLPTRPDHRCVAALVVTGPAWPHRPRQGHCPARAEQVPQAMSAGRMPIGDLHLADVVRHAVRGLLQCSTPLQLPVGILRAHGTTETAPFGGTEFENSANRSRFSSREVMWSRQRGGPHDSRTADVGTAGTVRYRRSGSQTKASATHR